MKTNQIITLKMINFGKIALVAFATIMTIISCETTEDNAIDVPNAQIATTAGVTTNTYTPVIVTLSSEATKTITIKVSSDNRNVTVPAEITIAAGGKSGYISVGGVSEGMSKVTIKISPSYANVTIADCTVTVKTSTPK